MKYGNSQNSKKNMWTHIILNKIYEFTKFHCKGVNSQNSTVSAWIHKDITWNHEITAPPGGLMTK